MHLTNYKLFNPKNHFYTNPIKGLRGYGLSYRFAFNGKERDDETYGTGNEYDFGARIYSPRLGQWLSIDNKTAKFPSWSPYNYAIDNPIVFIDPDGNDVIISVSATPVGTTKMNLYSAGEIKNDVSLKNKTKIVPVYEVNITNELGSTATFYFTRDAYRGQSDNTSVKEVTFNVRENNEEFQGKIKSRWGGSDNVLELRDPNDINDQSVDAMKVDQEVSRTAIQFHVKGASDGCLLCVGKDQFESKEEGATINETDLKSNSGETQKNFMKKIIDFRKEDMVAGKGDKIKVKFEKVEKEEESN